MRKITLLLMILAVGAVGGLWAAAAGVNGSRDQVVFQETTQMGDRTAAQGLQVNIRTQLRENLFWNTSCVIGEESQADTEYQFSSLPISGSDGNDRGFQMDIGYFASANESGDSKEMLEMMEELKESTGLGERRQMTVRMADYFEYYPVFPELWPFEYYEAENSGSQDNGEPVPGSRAYAAQVFEEYFRIPVLENETWEFVFERDSAGNSTSMNSGPVGESFSAWTESVVTEDACYFTFFNRTGTGAAVDTSLIPGGYGLYRFPLETHESGSVTANVDELDTVYAMDPSALFLGIYQDPRQTHLFLHTAEDGKHVVTVLDAGTAKVLQRLELAPWTKDSSLLHVHQGEDFFAVLRTDGLLAVAVMEEDGQYKIDLVQNWGNGEEGIEYLYYASRKMDMDYNGSCLAVAGPLPDPVFHFDTSSFFLAIYGDGGIQYLGTYKNSLDTGQDDDSRYSCQPTGERPVSVTWR